jgi:flagellar FliJ protein
MTKVFNFSLNKVLDYRQNVEDSCGVVLKKALSHLEAEQGKLNELIEHKDVVLKDTAGDEYPDQNPTAASLLQTIDYITQLNEKINSQTDSVKKSFLSVKKNRDELIKALKNRKSLEKLKEKHFRAYYKAIRKKEKYRESEVALRMVNNNKTREIT